MGARSRQRFTGASGRRAASGPTPTLGSRASGQVGPQNQDAGGSICSEGWVPSFGIDPLASGETRRAMVERLGDIALDGASRKPQPRRDLGMSEPVDPVQQERMALQLRQLVARGEAAPQPGRGLGDVVGRRLGRWQRREARVGVGRALALELREAGGDLADDPKKIARGFSIASASECCISRR